MYLATMKRISKLWISLLLLTLSSLFGQAAFGYTIVLEGQNKGDTNNWYAGNLQNWQELEYIPCRVHFTGAQGSNQTIVIYFEHYNGNKGIPGFQNGRLCVVHRSHGSRGPSQHR